MSPRLKISSYVIDRLLKLDTSVTTGCLFGLMYDSTLIILGFSLELDEENVTSTYENVFLNFPTEVELCGVVKFSTNSSSECRIKTILQNVDMTDNPIILTSTPDALKAHFLIHDRLVDVEYEVVAVDDIWKEFVHFRLQTMLPLFCEATSNGVKEALLNKRKKIASGQVSFRFPGTDVYLVGSDNEAGVCGLKDESTVEDLLNHSAIEHSNKTKKKNIQDIDIIPVDLVIKASRDIISDKLVKTAVKIMSTQGKPAYCIKLPLVIDTLAMTHRKTKLIVLYNILVESTCRSLRLLEQNLLEQLGEEGTGDGAGLRIPETFHFFPSNCGHFYTRIIPKGITENSSVKDREIIHELLGLPLLYPFFRRGNAYPFNKQPVGEPLINPHFFMNKPTQKAETTVAVVRGFYAYHHYMQDNFDDSGWGCAYRSLQTLWSWFRYQGYTEQPVPTHKQIQQCLVKIGDKTSSFIGSKNWIGSTEVCFVLETLLGVQSKMIFANTGTDLQSYGSELVFHFQRHGSPIMIGGGVLAHTILGVEYNSDTGDIRYLILDPHYTGEENINTVLNKGWCSWKTNDFWVKTAHYNLCLPLTTACV